MTDTRPSIQEMVRRDLIWREQEGIRRYGTSLMAYNGRAAILDAYEEAMDLVCYLRQLIEEMTVGDGRFDGSQTSEDVIRNRPDLNK